MGRLVVLQLIAGAIGGLLAAKKDRSILFWALACFLFPLLAVILAFLPPLRAAERAMLCPGCSRPIDRNDHVCRYCGRKQTIDLVQCRKCGSFVPENEDCPVCRKQRE
ncbi:MAG TPA: hypothetical protein VEP69_00915 [Thermodesulfovibrionales bacterium]|nr:hypothetical protein [Thermodesulfovibrionales bacterium]